jgi:subtilisin-like proprotein convertase family protein
MQRRTRVWVIIGLVFVVLAVCLWRFGFDHGRKTPASPETAAIVDPRPEPVPELGALNWAEARPLPSTNAEPKDTNISHNIPLLTYRVKNTQKPIGELIYSDSAILLRNALFDAAEPAPLEIPAHLRSQGDPGSYVVQARGAIDNAFLGRLNASGVQIISYIPNNAYLVRANQASANRLSAAPEVQSVLPWEPYFKLDLSLLALAVNQDPMSDDERVSVVVFPGEREAGLEAVAALGAHLLGEDTSPFGHQIIVQPRSDSLIALAQLSIVQSIEPHRGRVLANDLSRVRIGAATNTMPATPNYLGLTGSNVVVNINDTGVEEAHPDLIGRVFGLRFDNSGHGTHVAGTIASTGSNSPPQAPGSTNGATFRGIAPSVRLYSQGIDIVTGPVVSDAFLQQNVARTNVLISNNSWGYPIGAYNQNAASYDAAVRDALPGTAGSSPIVFVFAAGNAGNPETDGRGRRSDQVASPGTAKNVITVGGMENLRNLTNMFQIGGITNFWFLDETDSDVQVANYSARGNVGVGLEGEFGRFKPDVVAPGSWIVSTRSSTWRDPTNLVSFDATRDVDEFIDRRSTNYYFRTIPDNAIGFLVRILRNSQSPAVIPRINVHTNMGNPPAVNANDFAAVLGPFPALPALLVTNISPGQFHFALVNTNSIGVHYDLLTVIISTNDFGDYFKELKLLNDQLAPYYRFESGTSMAAGVVSGTLALMQEFYQGRLQLTNSPAMMKALLINGARSLNGPCTGCGYDLQVRKNVNSQGWGMVRVTNSIPKAMDSFRTESNRWPTIMFDQDPANALATGESQTYTVQLNTRARFEPLMVTLVWTDPPGNPVASTKLVNDLDLIVTNVSGVGTTDEYFIGNYITRGSDYNDPIFLADSNPPPFDVVNNVENVFIRPSNDQPLGAQYSITVRARRVNVNAITAQTNGIRQDYALVISSGNSALSNTFNSVTFSSPIVRATDTNIFLQSLSNKVAKFDQRVGANSPQLPVMFGNQPGPSHGITNQWNFYVFNNTNARHTNIAFITFLAPDLSVPRIREADIDLYVTRDSTLTNLHPVAVSGARKSLNRGGTEMVILTGANAPMGDFFVGVKSEDQQAASYGIFVVAQEKPFGERGDDGNIRMEFFPINGDGCIPDGSPENPGGARFFCPIADPFSPNVRRLVLTNDVDHDKGGDLYGSLTSMGASAGGVPPVAVLNNHRAFPVGPQMFIYDDSGEDDILGSRKSDGPGSLRDFEGGPANGLWQFVMVDNAPSHIGCVTRVLGMIEPQDDTNAMGNGVVLTIDPGKWRFTSVDVPPGVTNLKVSLTHEPSAQVSGTGPLDVYMRRSLRPTLGIFDKYGRVQLPPGGEVNHHRFDIPSLQSGRYHIGIFNPGTAAIRFRLRIEFEYSLRPLESFTYESSPSAIIPDDLTTNFVIAVTNARNVADVKVGVRIDHPRLSDLVLHLVSPEGTRILLTENRGLSLGTNYGEGLPKNFIIPINSSGVDTQTNILINTSNRQGIVRINFSSYEIADSLRVYYEGNRIFDSGYISVTNRLFNIPYGPGISTFIEIVVNEGGNPNPGTIWDMTVQITGPWNYALFTDQATLGDPIKFAFPPFSRDPTNIVVFSNSFENVFPGLYATNPSPPAITTIADWTVVSNSVAILGDTNVAHSGSNFLALSHGMISRGITNLLPGREYFLNFAQRKISSSPTQNVHVPVQTDDTPYEALSPFPPPGADDPVEVPKLRVCPGQDVVVISTNEVDFSGQKYTAQGDTNTIVNGFPKNGLIGCWSSHPTDLSPRTAASPPFYIGGGVSNGVVIAAPSEPGDYYLFLGVNDDDYADNIGTYEVDLRWAQCQLATADYVLGNNPVDFEGKWRTNWAGESLFFMANPRTTNIAFRADHNSTILLDTVVIDELVPSAHYLSEEPLAPLRGETAMGNWLLEVTDNRVGPPAAGTNSMLLSWSLKFIFEDGPNPIPLTNGVPFRFTVRGGQVHYFVVYVPLEVNTNNIRFGSTGNGAGIELLYSPFGLPEGAMPPDPILPIVENPIGAGTFGVSSNSPALAPITPGRPYFLAIRNVDPLTPANNYSITVDFVNIPIRQLFSDIFINADIPPMPGTFLQTRADSSLAVANMHYYFFDVYSSSDPFAHNMFFELASADPANIHLVASRALPVVDLFPRPTFYEYHSTENIFRDTIIIKSNSIPVKFAPGRWYLGVYNVGPARANYSIKVLESRFPVFNVSYPDIDFIGPDFTRWSTNFTIPGGNDLKNFYHFITHETNAAVLFEIFGMGLGAPWATSDLDLIVRRSDLPSRDLYDFSFLSTGPAPGSGNVLTNTGYEPIPLRTNMFIPTLGVNTNWYVAIANRGSGDVSGTLCVTIFNNLNSPMIGCNFRPRAGPIVNGILTLCWDSIDNTTYDVESSDNLVDWVPVPGATGIPGNSSAGSCANIPVQQSAFLFFRIRAY